MKTQFDLIGNDSHLIFNYQGQAVLIDTGSPISISEKPLWQFLGSNYRMLSNQRLITDIRKDIDCDIGVSMGLNLLKNYNVLIDYPSKKVTFSDDPIQMENSVATHLILFATDLAAVNLLIDGEIYHFVLDTGSKISYVPPQFTKHLKKIGEVEQYFPGYGHFNAPLYEMDIEIAGEHFKAITSNLPTEIRDTCLQLGISHIIGLDLFKSFKVALNFNKEELLAAK